MENEFVFQNNFENLKKLQIITNIDFFIKSLANNPIFLNNPPFSPAPPFLEKISHPTLFAKFEEVNPPFKKGEGFEL